MFNKSYYDYSDDSTTINIKVKEVSSQEAADFYVKHLEDFKSKIIQTGTVNILGIENRWFTYPDHYTDDTKLYCKFNINGKEHKFDTTLCRSRIRFSDAVNMKEYFTEVIFDRLTSLIRDEVLKNGVDVILDVIDDYKRR